MGPDKHTHTHTHTHTLYRRTILLFQPCCPDYRPLEEGISESVGVVRSEYLAWHRNNAVIPAVKQQTLLSPFFDKVFKSNSLAHKGSVAGKLRGNEPLVGGGRRKWKLKKVFLKESFHFHTHEMKRLCCYVTADLRTGRLYGSYHTLIGSRNVPPLSKENTFERGGVLTSDESRRGRCERKSSADKPLMLSCWWYSCISAYVDQYVTRNVRREMPKVCLRWSRKSTLSV